MIKSEGNLFLLGVSHHTAPLEIRERVALREDQMEALYDHLRKIERLKECLILNTCNRVELYGVSDDGTIQDRLEEFFCQFHRLDRSLFSRYGFWKADLEAIRHLFEVSAGINSQMIGETEIFGQVKSSYTIAATKAAVGPFLHRVLQKSFQAAKWVRTHSAINKGQVSIGNVAVDLARRIFGKLEPSRILVIGTGEVGEKTVKSLKSRGASSITISSQTLSKAEDLAREIGGQALPFHHCEDTLPVFNIVICSTAAPRTLLTRSSVATAMKQRPNLPLFLIDLAVPRNIDVAAAELTNVYLYNLDDLAIIVNENRKNRMSEIEKCRQVLHAKADYLWDSLNSLPGR